MLKSQKYKLGHKAEGKLLKYAFIYNDDIHSKDLMTIWIPSPNDVSYKFVYISYIIMTDAMKKW